MITMICDSYFVEAVSTGVVAVSIKIPAENIERTFVHRVKNCRPPTLDLCSCYLGLRAIDNRLHGAKLNLIFHSQDIIDIITGTDIPKFYTKCVALRKLITQFNTELVIIDKHHSTFDRLRQIMNYVVRHNTEYDSEDKLCQRILR